MAKKNEESEVISQIAMHHEPLIKLLLGLYHTKVPTMIWSQPGCGKTATVTMLGDVLKVPTILRSGNKADPTDFSGIPYLSENEVGAKDVKVSKPTYIRELEKAENGILFFDEINTCPTSIQVALLSIIQDCQFGEFTIPRTTFRVAAGNYAETLGNRQMSPALMNRFVHLFVESNPEQWCNGFVSGFQNFERPIINSPEEQQKRLLKYRLAVVDFIKEHPDYLSMYPEEFNNKTDVAFPTPRSWDLATQILSVIDENSEEYKEELLRGVIGTTVTPIFMSYISNYQGLGVDLTTFVGNEQSFRLPNPNKADHVDKIMKSIVYYLTQEPKKYYPLWIHVVNTIYNKDEKWGKYDGYATLIMAFLQSNVSYLLDTKTILPKDLEADLAKKMDCYQELMPLIGY